MSDVIHRFIAHMKLRELSLQRERLLAAYASLQERAAEAASDHDRLRLLVEGLSAMTFGTTALHPNVATHKPLLQAADASAVTPHLVALAVEDVQHELDFGRRRTEAVYLFGALLEEWASGTPDEVADSATRFADLLDAQATPADVGQIDAVIDDLLDGREDLAETVGQQFEKALYLDRQVGATDVEHYATSIARDPYRPGRTRAIARRLIGDEALRKELGDALSIMIAHLDEWDWPEDGVPAQPAWTRNKWRLALGEDAPTSMFLTLAGGAIGRAIEAAFRDSAVSNRETRLARLLELKAPQVIIDNERRMLAEERARAVVFAHERDEVWPVNGNRDDAGAAEGEPADPTATGASIRALREVEARTIGTAQEGYSDDDDYDSTPWRLLSLVHAEIQVVRAACPKTPIHVLRLDLADFYPTLSHAMLLRILERFQIPERVRTFIAKCLRVPIRTGGDGDGGGDAAVTRVERGLLFGRALSHTLAGLVLRLLDDALRRAARVRVFRMVDDICLLGPSEADVRDGLAAVRRFCERVGLKLNDDKAGYVCIGGADDDGDTPKPRKGKPSAGAEPLPTAPPRWSLLELNKRGEWHIAKDALDAAIAGARERIAAVEPVLAKVQRFNEELRWLLAWLAPASRLGDTHREGVHSALTRFQNEVAPLGITDTLLELVRNRFNVDDLPAAWLHWPITAGGLGLHQPRLETLGLELAYTRATEPPDPDDLSEIENDIPF